MMHVYFCIDSFFLAGAQLIGNSTHRIQMSLKIMFNSNFILDQPYNSSYRARLLTFSFVSTTAVRRRNKHTLVGQISLAC
jgi:hypothetical protein